MVSSLPRIMRVSTGDAPPLEKATISGERSRMAGMMKLHNSGSSTTFTGMLRAWAGSRNMLVDAAVIGRRDDQCHAIKVLCIEIARRWSRHFSVLPMRLDLRRDHAHFRSRLQQHACLALGDLAAADHQAQLVPDIGKDRQIVHYCCTAFRISGTSASGSLILPASANSWARDDIFCQVLRMIGIHFASSYSGCCATNPAM